MSHFLLALQSLASPGVIIMCLAGVCLGIVLGAIPGLSGSLAIIIMMPITFKMDASVAFATSFHTIQKLLLTASEVDSSVRKILRSTAFESASHTRPTRLLQKMPRFALNS